MGKRDKKTRRGKIFAGSFGKSRPKHKKASYTPLAEEKPVAKPVRKKKAKSTE